MKTLLLTNEYPPYTYGGAGVHVEYLSQQLAQLMDVDVRAFGDQNLQQGALRVRGFDFSKAGYTCPPNLQGLFGAAQRCLDFNTTKIDADVVHCHTWYTHLGGIMAKLCYGIPLVVTVHSLEPLRPWKREQLGGGYDFSCWVEKTALEMADAVIAVSHGTKTDVLKHFDVPENRIHIIYNGIDPEEYRPVDAASALQRYGIDPKQPYLLFVGRITRQKGIIYLVEAIKHMDPSYQVVLCAGAPDTPEIAEEMKQAVAAASKERSGIHWIAEKVDKPTLIQLYSGASVFCCPSIYEPFGIINLEAMACETPVVGSCVGGIPEVVVHDETGFLVPVAQHQESPFTPYHPEEFSKDLAHQINRLMKDEALRNRFAKAGRIRAVDTFSWQAIAKQTHQLYAQIIAQHGTLA
ncbi:MAG: glycogen synthase [Verrucomicrobiota bacterium JB022]|nr:glycogen synthase [Verrucomicrobiota bacterium JB022]